MLKVKINSEADRKKKKDRKRALDRERAREYRRKVKDDPERNIEVLKKASERNKKYRQGMTEEAKARQRENARIRQQRLREKRKQNGVKIVSSKKVTRAEYERKKDYNRDMKRRERANMSGQKRRRIREKDRTRKREKVAAKCKHSPSLSTPSKPQPYSSTARRKAISRIVSRMPSDASKYASIISGMISKATPSRKDALRAEGVLTSPDKVKKQLNFCEKLPEIFKEDSKKEKDRSKRRFIVTILAKTLKKYQLMRQGARSTGISWKYMQKYSQTSSDSDFKRKIRSDATSPETVARVAGFYHSSDVATVLPNAKLVQDGSPASIMTKNVSEAFNDYSQLYPEDAIGLSTFANLRPKHILLSKHQKLIQCLCEYCSNIDEFLKVLNKACSQQNKPELKLDRIKALNITLCDKGQQDFHKLECVDRACDHCNVSALREHFAAAVDASGDQPINHYQWVNQQFLRHGKSSTRKAYSQQSAIMAKIVDDLCEQMGPYAKHMFVARWQHKMYAGIKKDVPIETVVTVIDFSENYSAFFQNAIQSVHWVNIQVTLFPMVSWYRCAECPDSPVNRDCFIFISDDQKHDSYAVHAFQMLAYSFLK